MDDSQHTIAEGGEHQAQVSSKAEVETGLSSSVSYGKYDNFAVDVDFLNIQQTRAFVKDQFKDQPKRLQHILKVAEKVAQTADYLKSALSQLEVSPIDAECAALVHDIGYLKPLQELDFHPIDGANFLRARGFPHVAGWIVCHSNSPEQSVLRGFGKIPISDHLIAKIITYWDVRVLQGGEVVSYEDRLVDIYQRYGDDHVVSQATRKAEPRIKELITEIDIFLVAAGASPQKSETT